MPMLWVNKYETVAKQNFRLAIPELDCFCRWMLKGTWCLSDVFGMSSVHETSHISISLAFVGGAARIIRSRTAGGCIFRHGISSIQHS